MSWPFFKFYRASFGLPEDQENVLVKPNYSFEKRQRDLEKKRKQEEKRLRKLADKKPTVGAESDAVADFGSATDQRDA